MSVNYCLCQNIGEDFNWKDVQLILLFPTTDVRFFVIIARNMKTENILYVTGDT